MADKAAEASVGMQAARQAVAKQTAQQSADAAEFARINADIDRTTEELQATIDEIKRQEGTADA